MTAIIYLSIQTWPLPIHFASKVQALLTVWANGAHPSIL